MKILVVNNCEARKLPPVINLVEALLANGHEVTIISYDTSKLLHRYKGRIRIITLHWPIHDNWLCKMIVFFINRYIIRAQTRKEMRRCDLLWTTSDRTLRELGGMVFHYKYIMQLQELVKDVHLLGLKKLPFRHGLKKYAKRAYKIVVPEYNRAHFIKIWFGLNELPAVFPNKPYKLVYKIEDVPKEVNGYIKKIQEEKRIKIIYQGCFAKDRNLTPVIEFVKKNTDKYCLLIIGFDMQKKEHRIQYEKYKDKEGFYVIPFILHPYYLELTKQADIGLLPYFPIKSGNESEFNALYCAPNKIYEYAWCGLPMIGPDIPGLRYPFAEYNIGRVYDENSIDSVGKAVKEVMGNYQVMSDNCRKFYVSTNLDHILDGILS